MQLQQHPQFTTIQVKQEFPNQNQLGNSNAMANEIKHQMVDHGHGQMQHMQLIDAPPVSPHHAPNSGAMGNSTTTISTMSPLQAIPTGPGDWSHSRLQLIQPSISNQGYLQQLYHPPVIMSGNIIHSGIGQQPIQVIATGKPFPSGGPQMIATQNKSMLGANGANFSGSYTIPGIPSSQSQALVFSPVSVINSQPQQQQQQQQQMLSSIPTQQNNNKQTQQDLQKTIQNQKIVQKVNTNNSLSNSQNLTGSNPNLHSQQCVQVSQAGAQPMQILNPLQQTGAQPMQIASPWVQSVPHFWANGIQPQTLLAQNPIIIRGTQADGTQGMFIQQATTHHAIQNQQANQQTLMQCNIPQAAKPRMQIETMTKPQQQQQQPRAPLILPQNAPPNRPASSVSTQTAQNQNLINQKQIKRNKQQAVRPALSVMKPDTVNQMKSGMHQMTQQHAMHQVVTTAGNKMVVVSTGTPVSLQNNGNIQQQTISSTDKQQIHMQQQIKQHQQTLLQQQQQQLQQQIMQQTPNQQLLQQQFAQQIQLQQSQIQNALQAGNFITHQQQQNQFIAHQQSQQQQRDQSHQQGVVQQIVVQQQPSQQHLQLQQIASLPNISTTNTSNMQTISINSKPITMSTEKLTNSQSSLPNISMITQTSSNNSMNILCSQPLITSSVATSTPIPISSASNPILAMTTLATSALPTTTATTTIGTTVTTTTKSAGTKTSDKTTDKTLTSNIVESSVNTSIKHNSSSNNVVSSNSNSSSNNNNKATSNNNNNSTITNNNKSTSNDNNNNNAIVKEKHENIISKKESQIKADKDTKNEIPNDKRNGENDIKDGKDIGKKEKKEAIMENGTEVIDITKMNGVEESNDRHPTVDKISLKLEKGLPKAMIKPNVLTHVIEGFVIQESNEPFPVGRTRYSEKDTSDEPPCKRQSLEDPIVNNAVGSAVCAHCGKKDIKTKLKKKKYCSSACVREAKLSVNNNDSSDKSEGSNSSDDNKSNENKTQSTTTNADKIINDANENAANVVQEESPLMQWSVSDVCEFIRNLPGCTDYADDFAMQEIDGQALLLLKENHLVNAMGMKLGPALKIVAKVESIKNCSVVDNSQ